MDTDQSEAFAVWMCELRKRLNVTQPALADMIGVSRSAVASWESGQRAPWPQSPARNTLSHLGETMQMPTLPNHEGRTPRTGARVSPDHDERFARHFPHAARS